MINRGADMVAHGRDFHIVSTIGAFNRGQEAHIHRRHPGSIQKVGTIEFQEGLMPCSSSEGVRP
jgi:hypothetical protein